MNPPMPHPCEFWQKVLDSHPDKVALWDAAGNAVLTFADLDRHAHALAKHWSAEIPHARPHADSTPVVALSLPSSPSWIVALLAVWKMKAVPLLLPSDSPSAAREQLELLGGACARVEQMGAVGAVESPARAIISPRSFLQFTPLPTPCGSVPSSWHLLKSTSGTTAAPRLLGFTAAALFADATQILTDMDFGPDDRCLGSIPFSHSYGFSNLVTPLLFFGVPLVCAFDPLPRALADSLTRSRATVWPAVPVLLHGLLQTGFTGEPSLRCTLSAGALLPAALALKFRRATGRPVHAFYGSSECGGICYDKEGLAAEIEGYVGTPMSQIVCQIIGNSENASRLAISGPTLMAGQIPSEFSSEGSFYPADLVEKLDAGFRILGRLDDMLNVGGKKIHPTTIENALNRLPGVRGAVVFGLPNRQQESSHQEGCIASRGHHIAAWLLLDPDTSLKDVTAAAIRALPSWQCPRHWQACARLPYNERGKLSRKALSEAWPSLPAL